MHRRVAALLFVGVLSVTQPAVGATRASDQRSARSCAGFVQHYYRWYRALKEQDTSEPTVSVAMRRRPALLSGALREALREDRAAEVRNRSGYIVGIDFDPILSGSDYADRYVTQRVTRRGHSYLVEVCGVVQKDGAKTLPVIAEVVRWRGRWIFLNFHYPKADGTGMRDLRTILEEQRKHRKAGRV